MLTLTAVGRIGRDVEVRRIADGTSVCNVAIGCNWGPKGQDGRATQWVEGAIWGDRAEALAEYLTKGKQVILQLRDVHIETYEGNNGTGHKLVGTVSELEFGADVRGDDGGGQQRGGQQRSQGGGQRSQGSQGQQRTQGGGYGDRGNRSQGQQRQQPAQQRQGGGGSSGFDDMDDDIPF
jgi:single-strand DNA-binding protein